MGKVLVEVGWSDLIECPQRISENIQRYADEFIKSRKCKINILRSVDKNGHSGKRTVSMGCSYETSDFRK